MLPCVMAALAALFVAPGAEAAGTKNPQVEKAIDRGLEWLVRNQSRTGSWSAQQIAYPTPMTGLAGMALLCEGSTTTQGKYASNIRRAVDFLVSQSRPNGLIGNPTRDDRYTYGHGFAMLFLSQVLGEEEDVERRQELIDVLSRAVRFTGEAQAASGGWGYVSCRDQPNFDEGSTTITQVQGLRGCRNAGVAVPHEIIDKAIHYIHRCTTPDGGVQYNSHGGGGRPAISAAAIACLYNAGEYDGEYVPRVLNYCRKNLGSVTADGFGHWHYTHYYYAQVMYRQGGKEWEEYRDKLYAKIAAEARPDGSWVDSMIGPVYATSINLTILQLERAALPIYQR
jgi:hypothetical protein